MKKYLLLLLMAVITVNAFAQQKIDSLTVNLIMRDQQWIGRSPSNIFWSPNGKKLYFDWGAEDESDDSLYYITFNNKTPKKADLQERERAQAEARGSYNKDKTKFIFNQQSDIYYIDLAKNNLIRITNTSERESQPQFTNNDSAVAFAKDDNLYSWNIQSGIIKQLTNFKEGHAPKKPKLRPEEKLLQEDALENSSVLRERDHKDKMNDSIKEVFKKLRPKTIYIGKQNILDINISPDGKYIFYQLIDHPDNKKRPIVPEYVTKSGFTETIPGRTNVGQAQGTFSSYIYNITTDTAYQIKTANLPGIKYLPDYVKDYPVKDSAVINHPPGRKVLINGPVWNDKGDEAVVILRATDHKDRWIMLVNQQNGQLKLLDRQHDSAWIDGPGIGWDFSTGNLGWINDHTIWFQSEESGYSHLYKEEINNGNKVALTSGDYEVQDAVLSKDKKYFYITTNQPEPAQTQYYRLSVNGGKAEKITTMEGGNEATVSPDDQYVAIRYSFSNKPWELYLQQNQPGAQPEQITHQAQSAEFASYLWRAPQIITFTDRDGEKVYARLFKPKQMAPTKPGVLFVHGAGYLQDAHKWWSYYFREFMFENLLADKGYTVMDVDYRGSAGYGRDWRTAIYRHMGGKDLDDEVDAAKYMADSLGVNPKRIGLWGGSYGGFMTLMALFKDSDVFACGAGLRSVTDWAHYNDGYTSDILNKPQEDSLAYRRSSPIYFAEGLQKPLLMCHGMEDTNVHFQDIVRLTEKLIELKKDNWQLAVYPLEDHGFVDASSWRDEYSRIYQLFNTYLK